MSQQNNTASGATGRSNNAVRTQGQETAKQQQQQTAQDDPFEQTRNDEINKNNTSNKREMKNENESKENKENEIQNDMNVLDMAIKQWLEHLEKISKNGKRKGMEKFSDVLIGENGEFEEYQTLRDIGKFKREKVEGWFDGVQGVSGLLSDLIDTLKLHWNKLQPNGM